MHWRGAEPFCTERIILTTHTKSGIQSGLSKMEKICFHSYIVFIENDNVGSIKSILKYLLQSHQTENKHSKNSTQLNILLFMIKYFEITI